MRLLNVGSAEEAAESEPALRRRMITS